MTRRVNFINTNRCNLRCVYCPQGTHPEEYYADLSPEMFDELFAFIKANNVEEVGLGYYGELTMIERWWEPVQQLLDAGIKVSTTTNGSTPLSDVEVETLARFKYIEWSIDTHNIERLKAVRKKVDARTIVHNLHRVKGHCIANDLPMPQIAFIGVLTKHIVHDLPEFIGFAASCGIKKVDFTEVAIYETAPQRGLNIVDIEDDAEFLRAADKVIKAHELAKKLGIHIYIAELPRILLRKNAAYFAPSLHKHDTPIATCLTHEEAVGLKPGETRKCSTPFDEFYIDPKGQMFSCCFRGNVMGVAKTQAEIEAVLQNNAYKRLRHALTTGENMDPTCRSCPIREAVPVGRPGGEAQDPAPQRPFWRRHFGKRQHPAKERELA